MTISTVLQLSTVIASCFIVVILLVLFFNWILSLQGTDSGECESAEPDYSSCAVDTSELSIRVAEEITNGRPGENIYYGRTADKNNVRIFNEHNGKWGSVGYQRGSPMYRSNGERFVPTDEEFDQLLEEQRKAWNKK